MMKEISYWRFTKGNVHMYVRAFSESQARRIIHREGYYPRFLKMTGETQMVVIDRSEDDFDCFPDWSEANERVA